MAGKRSIKIPDFQKEIQKILDDYGDNLTEQTRQAVTKVAEIAKKEIQSGSPVRTSKYRSGWTVKTDATSRLRTETVIYNRSKYQLTHLLEKGHALRQGGRAPAYPHIRPAEEHAVKNMKEAIEQIAKNG